MTEQVKINGIRLNKNYIQMTQVDIDRRDQPCVPLYQILASDKINMVFIVLNTIGDRSYISGSIASKHLGQPARQDGNLDYHRNVCIISIYPHHYRLRSLGFLLSLMGRLKLSFRHMVSSNAMLTFVVDQTDCDAVIDIFSKNFDLPESHVPFEQEQNEEFTQFLKRKYPETRATYVEKKIKTYGIALESGLNLSFYLFSFDRLATFGQEIQSMEDKENKFFHTSAYMETPAQIHLFLLTGKKLGIPARQTCAAELINFHGPHFGDRHSIISRALNCLSEKSIPVLQTGCTGASIGIVLPQGKGEEAKQALMDVFEIP
ncbi:hypothetical protein [Desulfobacula sp.]|uniref:hypothetical protein n=1 Tax=Desulfobacula sp. TaxID=2593537 RepID=UPI002634FCF7|nr:hypothetical protein [Desulfobacula sp.]